MQLLTMLRVHLPRALMESRMVRQPLRNSTPARIRNASPGKLNKNQTTRPVSNVVTGPSGGSGSPHPAALRQLCLAPLAAQYGSTINKKGVGCPKAAYPGSDHPMTFRNASRCVHRSSAEAVLDVAGRLQGDFRSFIHQTSGFFLDTSLRCTVFRKPES